MNWFTDAFSSKPPTAGKPSITVKSQEGSSQEDSVKLKRVIQITAKAVERATQDEVFEDDLDRLNTLEFNLLNLTEETCINWVKIMKRGIEPLVVQEAILDYIAERKQEEVPRPHFEQKCGVPFTPEKLRRRQSAVDGYVQEFTPLFLNSYRMVCESNSHDDPQERLAILNALEPLYIEGRAKKAAEFSGWGTMSEGARMYDLDVIALAVIQMIRNHKYLVLQDKLRP